MFRVIFTEAAQNSRFPMHTTPRECPIFRTSSGSFYAPKPEPDFQLRSAHALGGSCTVNEEAHSSEVSFLLHAIAALHSANWGHRPLVHHLPCL